MLASLKFILGYFSMSLQLERRFKKMSKFAASFALAISISSGVPMPSFASQKGMSKNQPETSDCSGVKRDGDIQTITVNPGSIPTPGLAISRAARCFLDLTPSTRGVIRLMAGTYEMSDYSVRLGSYTTLKGEGASETILRWTSPKSDDDEFIGVPSKGGPFRSIHIEDLTIIGPGHTEDPGIKRRDGIQIRAASDLFIRGVAVEKFSRDGINLSTYRGVGVRNSSIVGNRVTENGRNGISLTNGDGNLIQSNEVRNNNLEKRGLVGVGGIVLEPDSSNSVTNTIVRENFVYDNGWNGIALATENKKKGRNSNNLICLNSIRRSGHRPILETSEDPKRPNIYLGNDPQPDIKDVMPGSIIIGNSTAHCDYSELTPGLIGLLNN